LWAGVPFHNKTALDDFAGMYELWCRDLAQTIGLLNGVTVRLWPLGSPGGAEWLQSIEAQNLEFARALGIAPPGDLSTYDLRDPSEHASWFWVLSQYSEVLRASAGLF